MEPRYDARHMSEDRIEATVVFKDQRGTYVLPDGLPPTEANHLRCSVRGGLKKELRADGRVKVVVGDRVSFSRIDGQGGVIEDLLPRRSVLLRRRARDGHRPQLTAANVDCIACVVSALDPEWKPGFVDRVLCAAELSEVRPWLIMNKMDLLTDEERAFTDERLGVYERLDIPVFRTSTATGEGVEVLREAARDQVTVVSGPSGVGKSSLLNRLGTLGEPLRTSHVSKSSRKGRHTTTSVKWIALEGGGAVIDTPGVRAFGFYDLDPGELDALFREIASYAYWDGDPDRRRCRFSDCTHREEPGCAVGHAVEEGEIDVERYESYLRIFDSLVEERRGHR
jgi:ribosome biogenesis GTPase